ncbi:MAG: hypothetical protein ACOC3V_00930 [bacterium]
MIKNYTNRTDEKEYDWFIEKNVTRTELIIKIPVKIKNVMEYLSKKYRGLEFSIITSTRYNKEEDIFIMNKEFYIPEQYVSRVFIDYKESIPPQYNTVIHKHPNGINHFSSTDVEYINTNFDFSLLWVNGQFEIGVTNIMSVYGKISFPLFPIIEYEELKKSQLKKIKIQKRRLEKFYEEQNII